MTHFGIFCPGAVGHLNPMCNLGKELLNRGHNVTLFGVPDVRAKIANSGINFYEIGASDFPLGSLDLLYAELGELSGMAGLKFSIQFFTKEAQMWLKEAPLAIKTVGVEVLLVDQVTTAMGTVADYLRLPFITVCNALLINREPSVPPYFTNWQYQNNFLAKLRNTLGNKLLNYLTSSLWNVLVEQRRQWQLTPHQRRDEAYSQLAQICQLPTIFDFPRENAPKQLYYTGPLQNPDGVEPVSFNQLNFPFDRLTDKPLIYASLGTLQNRNWTIFQAIAEACLDLDAQLVISLGNPNQDVSQLSLAGSPIVVAYAPHQQIINLSTLVITHAGLNTTIGTLSSGIPLVAIPITNEQPGIAARLAKTGAGKVVPIKKLTVPKLKAAIVEVLTNPSYRENAARIQSAIQESGGVYTAVDIIEKTLVRIAN